MFYTYILTPIYHITKHLFTGMSENIEFSDLSSLFLNSVKPRLTTAIFKRGNGKSGNGEYRGISGNIGECRGMSGNIGEYRGTGNIGESLKRGTSGNL